ncbi:MAG TPA: hypothetical protein VL442_00015 [Mucilaginibacter sp.]|jgi:hypothetical protein|nr:hypothetical protein [Mucilaginibacter sp.]
MKNNILLILTVILLSGCVKDKAPTLLTAALSFPLNNSACTTGTVISDTQSSINFTWNTVTDADSYVLNVKNLLTGQVITQTVQGNNFQISLLRDTPYSWFVVAYSSQKGLSSTSAVWKFYNAGLGTLSHPPFPADGLSPAYGDNVTAASGTINLTWTGSDPDNDISNYDVYFGSAGNPPIYKSNISANSVSSVQVTSGSTYYWKVITRDAQGNISDSGIFQFKVK